MGIRFACHVCDQKLNIKSDLAGRRGICPSCAARFRIPVQDAEKSSPIEDEAAPNLVPSGGEPAGQSPAGEPKTAETPSPSKPPATILDEESDGTWYVRPPSGGQYGPATTDVLRQWINEGRVAATALLWREGWPQWRGADEALPELVAKLPDNEIADAIPRPQPQPTKPVAPPSSSIDAERNRSPKAPAAGAAVVESTPVASSKLVGEATVGTVRRKRSNRRVYVIGFLTAIAASLIAALIFVANR